MSCARLEALTPSSVERLINAKIDGAIAPSLAGTIAAKTGGNPFFVEEIVKLLREQAALAQTESGWELKPSHRFNVPDSVKLVISERVEQLGRPAAELLAIAAVIGRQFTQRLLQTLAATDEKSVADVLDRCENAGVVTGAPALANDGYKFFHDLIQEALYESIGAAQRRRYHLAIGRALENLHRDDSDTDCEALAHHFFAGNDLAKALIYALKAGESAERSFSWARAASHFETALALLGKQSGDTAAKARLHEKLAELASLLGQANLEHSHKALEFFTVVNDLPKACRLQQLIGVAWTSGTAGKVDLEKAVGHFEKAAEIIEPQPDSTEKALAHGYLAFGLLRARLDLPRARSEAEKALLIANNLNDADVQARVYTELGVTQSFVGDLSYADDSAERSWQISRRAKDPWMGARAALYPIAFWPWRNDRSWLDLWTRRCLEHREAARVTRYDLAIFSLQSLLMALTGRPEQARQALSLAEEAIAERGYFTPYWLHFTAAAWAILANDNKASDLFEEARKTSQAGSLLSNIPEVVLYARFLIARGDAAKADDILKDGYRLAKKHDSVVQEINLLPLLAEASVRGGELQRAAAYLAEAEPLQHRLSAWRGLARPVFTSRGVLATAQAAWEAADGAFAAALELERRHGFLYSEADILLKWAESFRHRGGARDSARAKDLTDQARTIFERCGATRDIERTRHLF